MSNVKSQMSDDQGMSLVETLMVVVAVGFIIILLANLPNSLNLIAKSKHLSLAREIAAKQIEDKRAVTYINLANGTSAISDTRLQSLPSGAGILEVEECSVEICTNSEALKHIKVTVSWIDNLKEQSISLETFVGEGGLNQ